MKVIRQEYQMDFEEHAKKIVRNQKKILKDIKEDEDQFKKEIEEKLRKQWASQYYYNIIMRGL